MPVKLHEVPVGPFLQLLWVPLNVSPAFQDINHSSQFGGIIINSINPLQKYVYVIIK